MTTTLRLHLVCVALMAAGTAMTGQGTTYKIAADIPLRGSKVIEVQTLESGGFAIGLTKDGAAEIIKIDETGVNRWTASLQGKLFGLQQARGRLLASTRQHEAGGVSYVVDSATGSVVRSFTTAVDQVLRLSAHGDAVVHYDNPFEAPARTVVVRRVGNGDTRTITTDNTVGAAAAIDFERVLVLTENGRLDLFQGNKRLWGRRLTGRTFLHGLQIASEMLLALVELPGGAFLVVDLASGQEIYRYSPVAPERALASLKILAEAKAAVAGLGASKRLGALASNMKPTLLPDGDVIIRSSAETEDLAVRLSPLIGVVQPLDRISRLRATLLSKGYGQAVSEASNVKAGAARVVFDSGGVGLVAAADRLLLLVPER